MSDDLLDLAARAVARMFSTVWAAADYVFHRGPRSAPSPPVEGWYEADNQA